MSKKNTKITKEQMRKLEKAARRQIEIEEGRKAIRTGYHQTDKKDIADKQSNDVNWLDEIMDDIDETIEANPILQEMVDRRLDD